MAAWSLPKTLTLNFPWCKDKIFFFLSPLFIGWALIFMEWQIKSFSSLESQSSMDALIKFLLPRALWFLWSGFRFWIQIKKSSQYWDDFCDPDRIQTCNLLIRSQMLYSVEPRDHFLNAMQRYAYFLIQQNFFGFFYQIVLILLNIAFIMQKRWFKTIKYDDLFA